MEVLLFSKYWLLFTSLDVVTTEETSIVISTAMRTSDLGTQFPSVGCTYLVKSLLSHNGH